MKLMNTLTAVTLAIAIVPLSGLSGSVLAGDRDNQRANSNQSASEHFLSRKPGGALYAGDVIGATVKHRQSGDDVGEVQDLIIGSNGRLLGAVVTTGGFMGLGGQSVSLGWKHLSHAVEDDAVILYVDINEETLKNAPEHERD